MTQPVQTPRKPTASLPADAEKFLNALKRMFIERARLTPAGAAFMTLTAGIGAIAYWKNNNMVFALFSCLVAFLVVSRFTPWLTARKLTMGRTMPEIIFASRPVTFFVTVTNGNQRLSAWGITVNDLIDVAAFRREAPPFFPRIPPQSSRQAPLTLRFRRRGRYRAETYEIECGFPFGFFSRLRHGRDPAEFIVLPKPRPMRRQLLPRESGTPVCGLDVAPWLGEEEEFKCLRPYQAGDPMKKIHWKTSARAGELIVRVMENKEHRRVTVLVDTQPEPSTRRLRRRVALERGVRVAASLAADLERRGYAYRFAVFAPEMVLTPFGRGNQHLLSTLELLAVLESTPDESPEALLREAVEEAGPRHHFILLLLSPRHVKPVKAFLGGETFESLHAFDVSKPGLPRIL
ncbi:MAG: DUF58 domain-containing protein [Planctomycetota bacterium]|jgi:uncharacterized protein (DUF58 family)